MINDRPVLLVDDDASIVDLIRLTLEDEGYKVVTASSGTEALTVLELLEPGLIMLDMRMTDMDGSEFVAAYRELPGLKAPILVVTAAQNAAERAAQVEADGFITKPFELDDLIREVQRHIRGGRGPY